MKNMILLAALVMGSSVFAADQLAPTYTLTFFNISEESALPQNNTVVGGEVLADTQNIKLVLNKGAACKSTACSRMMMMPFQLTLPIINTTVDNCGITTIVAGQDLSFEGGEKIQVEVVDHKGDTCLRAAMVRLVSVTVTENIANDPQPVVSTMTGLPIQN